MKSPRADGWSLTRRLMALMVCSILSTLLVGGIALHWAAHQQDSNLLDARLRDLARTILEFSSHEIREIQAEGRVDRMHVETLATLGQRYRYQIWSLRDSSILLHSFASSHSAPLLPLHIRGFRNADLDRQQWRVFAMTDGSEEMLIQVAENLESRDSIEAGFDPIMIAAMLVFFALATFLSRSFLLRLLRPITDAAHQLRARHSGDLKPLRVDNPPRELDPMVVAVNTMFERASQQLQIERQFTSSAAHELRTPLAGIRANAQLAMKVESRAELAESLGDVMRGVDRAAHLIDQLLDLARLEMRVSEGPVTMSEVVLEEVYARVHKDLAPLFDERLHVVATSFSARSVVALEFGIELLLVNLVGNAVRYTPAGGRIQIASVARDGQVELTVDDSGPGIPEAMRHRIYARFDRLGRRDGHGVGLGMAIVASVVAMHRARIELRDSILGGLQVALLFPRPPGTAPAAPNQAGAESMRSTTR